MRNDYEVNAFIFDRETIDELITMFEHDKLDSTLLTKEGYKKRSPYGTSLQNMLCANRV